MKGLFHSLLIIASFLLVFLWEQAGLSELTVPALGFLIFLYLILSRKQTSNSVIPGRSSANQNDDSRIPSVESNQLDPGQARTSDSGRSFDRLRIARMTDRDSWNIFILNTIILLLIFSTGGFQSSLFFLLYFLCFGIAFVLMPETVFVFALCVIAIFFQEAMQGEVIANLIRLGSLAIISPLGYFFGKEFKERFKMQTELDTLKETSKSVADEVTADVDEVLHNEKEKLDQDDVDKLDHILEETEELRRETK